MAETEKPAAVKKQTKGGRKGGTTYPHLNLQKALDYAKKLVAKTHTGPQPEKTILPDVFGNSGPLGKVRASALKQFGLLEGGIEAYQATQLAKDIDGALAEERQPLLERALEHRNEPRSTGTIRGRRRSRKIPNTNAPPHSRTSSSRKVARPSNRRWSKTSLAVPFERACRCGCSQTASSVYF